MRRNQLGNRKVAYEHMKRCSISPVIREIQIKTIMRYHLTLIRMATIKKNGKQLVLSRMWRNWKPCAWLWDCNCCGKQYGGFSKS